MLIYFKISFQKTNKKMNSTIGIRSPITLRDPKFVFTFVKVLGSQKSSIPLLTKKKKASFSIHALPLLILPT